MEAFELRLHATEEHGIPLGMEGRAGNRLHDFLGQLTSRTVPILGFPRLVLLGFYQERATHLLHFLFLILYGVYYVTSWFFIFSCDLPKFGIPPVLKFLEYTFAVRRVIITVPSSDHMRHLWGVNPLNCRLITWHRVYNNVEGL